MGKRTKKGKITIEREACKGCYLCISVCSKKVIRISDKLNQQGYYPAEFKENEGEGKVCSGCSMCAIMCPDVAIEVYRE
ncbi:MAG: 4Fe-4S dicluster domain-containing protein [Deltaproteobacteria bacterium]|nr:4Fe-4S dicluster domain-containing protein [Deltaproteobacteria bacterium]